jgi:hypothetical protein
MDSRGRVTKMEMMRSMELTKAMIVTATVAVGVGGSAPVDESGAAGHQRWWTASAVVIGCFLLL